MDFRTLRAPAAKWRAKVVPPAPPASPPPQPARAQTKPPPPPTHRGRYRPWAELLRRTFSVDREHCPDCAGPMKLRALVTVPASIARILGHLGEPTEPPPLSPARGPPYLRSPVLRRTGADCDCEQTYD